MLLLSRPDRDRRVEAMVAASLASCITQKRGWCRRRLAAAWEMQRWLLRPGSRGRAGLSPHEGTLSC